MSISSFWRFCVSVLGSASVLILFGVFISVVDFQSTVQESIAETGEDGISYYQVLGRAQRSLDALQSDSKRQDRIRELQGLLKEKSLNELNLKAQLKSKTEALEARIGLFVRNFDCPPVVDPVSFDVDACFISGAQPPVEVTDTTINPRTRYETQIEEAKTLQREIAALRTDRLSVEGDSSLIKQEIDELSVSPEFADAIRNDALNSVIQGTMVELDMIDSNLIAISYLIYVPPLLCAVLLVAIAGALGSLISILFFKVYPGSSSNHLVANRGVGEFNRVALGSMVSVAIFLAMGSTTLVLNPGSALSGGLGTNAVSLSFIGILGGVFSEKVATWLAGRVDGFLREPGKKPEETV